MLGFPSASVTTTRLNHLSLSLLACDFPASSLIRTLLSSANSYQGAMEFMLKGMSEDITECSLDEMGIQRCPFLKNINKPTCFSFSGPIFPFPVRGVKGPIFEDGPGFDTAFKLFHGKDGIVPLSGRSNFLDKLPEPESTPQFNPLAAKAATISLSAFGPGGPFSFGDFSEKWKKQKSKSSNKRDPSSQKGSSSKHEALGDEWLKTGNCPIAKSFRAVSRVVPLVASAFQPPPGVNFRCPPAIVAARAALARTAFVKNLRPQPLPAKMLVIAALGMAANVPLGVWREHTQKFSLSWFVAVHAAVPMIAMLRKSVLMPKTAMVLTIAASIIGQVIGSRAERLRLKAIAEKGQASAELPSLSTSSIYGLTQVDAIVGGRCGVEGMMFDPLLKNGGQTSSPANVCS